MHKIELARDAESVYRLLFARDRRLFERIRTALESIAEEPRSGKRLKGAFSGLWSFRVGSYRVVYRVEDARVTVVVLDIGHRREVYR